MGSPRHGARNLVDVQLHTVCADKRECDTCGFTPCGTDYSEQPGVGIALVGRLAWPGSPSGPLPDDNVLLPDPPWKQSIVVTFEGYYRFPINFPVD